MKWIVAIFLLLGGYATSAQSDKSQGGHKREVLTQVSQMPEFPGGIDPLRKFLAMNVVYPKKAVDDGTEGIVVVKFVVTETGDLEDFEILATVSQELDEEAIRVIRSMPKWKPGKNNGQPVAVLMTLPVTFEISD